MTQQPKHNSDGRPRGTLLRFYETLSPLLVSLAKQLSPFIAKLETGVSQRQGLMDRLAASAEKVRGGVWFHVTSVGEYEQARPIIAALKDHPNPPPVMVTHFSPSGYDFALKRPCADVHEYLPFDHPDAMDRLVRLWQPRLLVFVKFDCWPNQVLAAVRQNIPVVLLAGSLQPGSSRLHPVARPLFREVFDHFAHIGVCTPDDARRFKENLGVSCPVTVTGDTRVEQVILRFESARDGATATELKNLGGRRLILGSTWPPDEKLWLPILPDLLDKHPDLKIVLTPHEPHQDRLLDLEKRLSRQGTSHCRLSTLMSQGAALQQNTRVVLVDSIGVLAEIYRSGDLAYVGGSFTTGVHNTMEPAVAAMPVMFGPRIQNAEEAGLLVAREAGFVLHKPAEALDRASRLLSDENLLLKTGTDARRVVLEQRGATKRSLEAIAPYLNFTGSDPHAT
jgi:3-deoxy-D-manno-octulosonic-acid transferase